jgi:uncharacterized membrane protein
LRTTEGLSRFLTFVDAVVAIAVTLLVLPLVEIANDVKDGDSFVTVMTRDHDQNLLKFYAFLLSFVVIARLWRAHHALFERVAAYDPFVVRVTLLWALTIVILPFPTQLTPVYGNERSVLAFYIGVLVVSSGSLTALSVHIARHRELRREDAPEHPVTTSVVTTLWCAIALLVALAVPKIGYAALLLLLLSDPTVKLVERRSSARHA